jgi:3-dehydroquinate dehydratase
VKVETQKQLNELFAILDNYSYLTDKLILIPLGEKYKMERIESLKRGSKYMFCYVTTPVVEGQLSYFDY